MIAGLLALLGSLIMVTQVMAGIWTSNNFLYKPGEGARGAQEKAMFDSGLNRVDTRLGNEKWVNDPAYGGDFQGAVTAIGTNPTVLHIPPSTWTIAADLTIPANITLKVPRGAILNIANGKTLTLNGGVDAGLCQIFSCTGTGKVILGPGSAKEVYPEWWGAKGDGVTDCTAAIAAATNAVDGKVPVIFGAGNYLVTDTLSLTVYKYSWQGLRTQRGMFPYGDSGGAWEPGGYSTVITFAPTDTTKFLVREFRAGDGYLDIGPFEHKNIKFSLGDANGFEFGRESLGVGDDATVQGHVNGVRFENFCITATVADRTTSAAGVITRSGRKMVWLTKNFETVFQDGTVIGGDTQIRTFGHDRPVFRNVRSKGAHLPFDLNGSGTFGVEAVTDSLQIEGWTFTPIRNYACGLQASNLRLEQLSVAASGPDGRYDLTAKLGITANVAAGATSLTFSQDMTGILFPGLSIIELSDGTADNTTTCLVSTVSGATAGIYSDSAANTYIHWSNATANVTRIHGYGPLSQPGGTNANSTYVNVAAGAALSTPAFVYVPGRSPMYIVNADVEEGGLSPSPSLVIGNRVGEAHYLNQQMTFSNCSPLVIGIPEHPMVHVNNWRQNYGTGGNDSAFRSKSGDLFSSFSQVQRVWSFTPKDSSTQAFNYVKTVPVLKLMGETNSSQFLYAWLLDDATEANQLVADKSLPTSGFIRVRIKAKAKNATGSLSYQFVGNGDGSNVPVALSTSAWTVVEVIVPVPAQWQGSRNGTYGAPGIMLKRVTEDIYVAGVTVEELPAGQGLPVLTAAPANPYQGMMVIANRTTWDPKTKGSGGPYPVWYNGSAWKLPSEQ
jgi:hypothetical protein